MEDENDLMSIFGSNQELNFDGNFTDTFDDSQDDVENTEDTENTNTNPVEEEDNPSENVDGSEDENNEGDDLTDESSPNLYSSIADVLFEQGIIPSLESSQEIKSVDDFVNVFKKEIGIQTDRKLEEYLNSLDVEKIASSRKTQIELNNIDEDYLKDNLEIAKDIIFRDYLNQGLSEDRARKMLRKAVDLGEDVLLEDALESVQSLKEFEAKQEEVEKARYAQSLEEQRKQQEQLDTTIKNYIYNSTEIVKGIPNTKALQEKVFKTMTEVVSKNPQTGELENKLMKDRSLNPIEFDTKMYYLYELTNGFSDLSKISNVVNSKAVKKLETVLRKTRFEDNGTPGYMQDPNSYNGFGSELVL
jgi:hypothetical protein